MMAEPTAAELSWSRPVRLVRVATGTPSRAGRIDLERVAELVDVGVTIAGVHAVKVSTARVGATRVVTELCPVSLPADDVATLTARRSLTALLDELTDADGVVPVAVAGSAFRFRVLEELAQVAGGTTVTYAGLAERSGSPRAARAVARVMATNTVPLLLPCHRVVPTAGGTGGYAFGPAVKAALLALEASQAFQALDRDEPCVQRSVA